MLFTSPVFGLKIYSSSHQKWLPMIQITTRAALACSFGLIAAGFFGESPSNCVAVCCLLPRMIQYVTWFLPPPTVRLCPSCFLKKRRLNTFEILASVQSLLNCFNVVNQRGDDVLHFL